jgi:heme-degrading monooxygenase HmoA
VTGLIALAPPPHEEATGHAAPHVSRISPPYHPIVAIAPEYSRLPVAEGFNWAEAFAAVDEGEWYLVVFRSRHRADADHAALTALDERASRAASEMPGFLYYFIGTPLADGSCLSFCLWRSRADAVAAAAHPEHVAAMTEGLPFFAHYGLERHRVVKRGGTVSFWPVEATQPAMMRAVMPSH